MTGLAETVNVDSVATISYSFEGSDTTGLTYNATGGSAPAGIASPFHGKNLKAAFGADTAFTDVREWSVSLACDVSDATASHASNTGRVKMAGFLSGTATLTQLASVDPQVTTGAAAAALKLYRTDTTGDGYYTGNAICTGVTHGVDNSGVDTLTYNFIWSGTVDLAVV